MSWWVGGSLRTCSFLFFGLGAAAAAAHKISTEAERGAEYSSFYVFVLCTAMLRTSIAAVVLSCFCFCPLDCDASVMVVDCAAVKTGCILEKYIPAKGCNKVRVHFYFWSRCCCCCCCYCVLLLLPTTSVLKRRYYFFFFGGCAAAALHSSRGMC